MSRPFHRDTQLVILALGPSESSDHIVFLIFIFVAFVSTGPNVQPGALEISSIDDPSFAILRSVTIPRI